MSNPMSEQQDIVERAKSWIDEKYWQEGTRTGTILRELTAEITRLRSIIESAIRYASGDPDGAIDWANAETLLRSWIEGHEKRADDAIDALAAAQNRCGELEAAEQCICAAVRLSNGEVWRGHRHQDAIDAATRAGNKVSGGDIQGFITSRNRFVDRVEAMQIQRRAGIPSQDTRGPLSNELFSEDLYLRHSDPVAAALAGQKEKE